MEVFHKSCIAALYDKQSRFPPQYVSRIIIGQSVAVFGGSRHAGASRIPLGKFSNRKRPGKE
jgi:hypothetical protein